MRVRAKSYERLRLRKPAAYLRYDDLLGFIEGKHFTQSSATRLWNALTANLPHEPRCFQVIDSNGKQLSLEEYQAWQASATAYQPYGTDRKRRQAWAVGRELACLFFTSTQGKAGKGIREYGTTSKRLLKAWLDL